VCPYGTVASVQARLAKPLPTCIANAIEHIWKYVDGASVTDFDFGETSHLSEAIALAPDGPNRNPESDLALRFYSPLFKKISTQVSSKTEKVKFELMEFLFNFPSSRMRTFLARPIRMYVQYRDLHLLVVLNWTSRQ